MMRGHLDRWVNHSRTCAASGRSRSAGAAAERRLPANTDCACGCAPTAAAVMTEHTMRTPADTTQDSGFTTVRQPPQTSQDMRCVLLHS